MIIYSVTVSVEREISEEWLSWMKSVHIPDVMATGYFKTHSIQRVLDPIVDVNMVTHNIQYRCESVLDLDQYQKEAAPALQKDHTERYKDKFVAFRTILKLV